MKSQDIKDYEEGCEIAEQIASVMRDGSCKDHTTLENWILENESSIEVVEKLTSENSLEEMLHEYNRDERDKTSELFLAYISQQRKNKKRRMIIRWSASVAAAIFALSLIVYVNKDKEKVETPATIAYHIDLSRSTVEKPTLKLENGSDVDLTADSSVKALNLEVFNNKLSYKKGEVIETEIKYNTLIIPKMYSYNVELADGTIAYLNANSELKYPTYFTGDTREVYLKGEGYFEVKKGTKPFIVHVEDMKIKVYGTKFNVNANNLSSIKTVLVSGSVGVCIKNRDEIMIKPNEMLTANISDGESNVKIVDCERYTAWIDDFFRYDDDRLETVLEDFSTWYGIGFTLSNSKDRNIVVTASFHKNTSMEEIIGIIEMATNLKFEKKNGEYIVK